ncbi:MAG: CpsD/CapB family tyrosine-protein kinase [Lachnospiraceae bacterium]|nr:CpsD/CapB family tyrosine-protein kinase [Lachnospiraceae bacterium]
MKDSKKKTSDEKKRVRKRHVINDDTPFIITEAYKMARTNLIFALSTSDKKIITFTSANPAEGKSTSTVNMAITLANTGAKVLLIDADMRKPTIHKLLKLNNPCGLSNIISGQCSINEARNINVKENLDVITAGPIPPNPSELLSSNKMSLALDLLKEKYEYICIDTPPINVVSDALLLNNLTSGIVFIVRENATSHVALQSALENIKLTNGKVLGFLKVQCNVEGKTGKSSSYSYNYEYKTEKTED